MEQEARWSTTHGLTNSAEWARLKDAVELGAKHRLYRAVYGPDSLSLVDRLIALEASSGMPVIACGPTAAALHGFGISADPRLHVTTPDGRSLRHRAGIVVHQSVPRDAVTEFANGVRAVAAAETAVDLAAGCPRIDVLAWLDAALRAGVPTHEITDAVGAASRRRGILQVRHFMPFANGAAESPMESRTRFRVLESGFPAPELQIPVIGCSGQARRIDLGWSRKRAGIEYDGFDFHSGADDLTKDRHRSNDLAGSWRLLHVTAADIYHHWPPINRALNALLIWSGPLSSGMVRRPTSGWGRAPRFRLTGRGVVSVSTGDARSD